MMRQSRRRRKRVSGAEVDVDVVVDEAGEEGPVGDEVALEGHKKAQDFAF